MPTLAIRNTAIVFNLPIMKQLMIFAAMVALVWACGGGEDPAATQSTDDGPQAVAAVDGQKIYKQYCVTCHGLYGDMGASGAYNLQTSELGLEERVQVIIHGRGAMTPFESILDPQEVEAVAEYTMTLKK